MQIENQYNIDKYLIPKLKMKCPNHTWVNAQNICLESGCPKSIISCPQCDESHLKEHKTQMHSLDKYVSQTTQDIENHERGNRQVLNEIFQQKENQGLFKYHNDSQIHILQVQKHIECQKKIIEDDMVNMHNNFKQICDSIQKKLSEKLDNYLEHYKKAFNEHKNIIEDVFKLHKSYSYYKNPNTLVCKLQSELPKNAEVFIKDLKTSIDNAKNTNNNKQNYTSGMKKMGQNINTLMDNIPMYSPSNLSDDQTQNITDMCLKFVQKRLTIQEDYQKLNVTKDMFQDSKKNLNYQILNDNKNLLVTPSQDELQLKPVKKFQLDIPVTAMTALSDIHLALASSYDSKLRIFESSQKKIHTISAHSQPITYLTKIITEDKYMNKKENQKSQKRVLLVSASQDYSVILWTFDYEMKTNPQVYSKLLGFSNIPMTILDLQDQQNIVTGDNRGEIIIWDAHNAKQVFQNSTQHGEKVSGLCLSKKLEKFVSVSEDNKIVIWKLKYGPNKSLESFSVENVIPVQYTGITSLNASLKDPTLIFFGTKTGSLKFYDIVNHKLIAETNAHSTHVLDLSLIEENISSKDSKSEFNSKLSLLSIGVNDKYIRMWKINKKKEDKDFSFNGLKLDVGINNTDITCKSKIQILKGPNPKFVIANEANKELLVYEISC